MSVFTWGEEAFATLAVNHYLSRVELAAEAGILHFYLCKVVFFANNVKRSLPPYVKPLKCRFDCYTICETKRRVGGGGVRRKHFRGFLEEETSEKYLSTLCAQVL